MASPNPGGFAAALLLGTLFVCAHACSGDSSSNSNIPPSDAAGSEGSDGSVTTDASLELGAEAEADATADVSADSGSDSALDAGSDSAFDSDTDSAGPLPVPLPPLSGGFSSLGCTFTGPSEASDQELAATLSASWPSICTTDGWCWENPLPAGGHVTSLWGWSSTDVWVGLEADRVLHWNGTSFDDEVPGVVVASLWGTSSNDLFAGGAVGSGGAIAHRTAQGWSVSPTTFPVVAVHGTSSTDVWAAAGNEVLHWNGSSWTPITVPTSTDLVDVHAYAPGDVWAISSDPKILRWNGSVWSETPVSWTPVAHLGGTGSNDVWMAAQTLASPSLGALLHWDGSTWTGFGPESDWDFHGSFWTFAPNDVWFKSAQGHLRQFDGTTWHWATQIGGGFSSLWASAPGDMWIGGGGGVPGYHSLTRGSVCTWAPAIHGVMGSLEQIHGSAPDDVWVTDGFSTILHDDGNGWRAIAFPSAIGFPETVFAVKKNDAWVAGGSEVARWNGTSWTEVPLSIGLVHGLHGSASDDIWVMGGSGVCHFDGVTWSCGSTPTGLWSVWSVSPGHAWATSGTTPSGVWKYDSAQGGWSKIPGWVSAWNAHTVYAPSSDEAWVTRTDGGLVHVHGSAIDDMALPVSGARAKGVFGFASNDVYIATDKGILHWNGTSLVAEPWTSWAVPTAIWGTSDKMLVIAGVAGAILRRTQQ